MSAFDLAAILIALAAVFGYLNHRFLRLPSSTGILAIALASSLVLLAADRLLPAWNLRDVLAGFLREIDFTEALLHGMLCFLLFAGSLHVELDGLLANRWTIGALATVGVLVSTAVVGGLAWALFRLLGLDAPLPVCFVFGALISPTDPIAVLGLLKALRAPEGLEAKIAGESLFNDGIGVVLFFALLTAAGLTGGPGAVNVPLDTVGLVLFFVREVAGGAVLGLALGYAAYRALKSLDDPPLELLLTLALVMFMYSLSFWLHVSGPIAVVTAGLFIGNRGKRFAMSPTTVAHVDAFWGMTDEILTAVLFLLLGLEVFAVPLTVPTLLAGALIVPVALAARWVSVAAPIAVLGRGRSFERGLVQILTWGGLRGGISVALVLSLPPFHAKDLLLTCTYAVVLFSVLVQGLTMRRLLFRYGVGTAAGGSPGPARPE